MLDQSSIMFRAPNEKYREEYKKIFPGENNHKCLLCKYSSFNNISGIKCSKYYYGDNSKEDCIFFEGTI